MPDIFLSYAREDQAQAEQIAHALESQGWSVFWDKQLVAGERWSEKIEAALHAAKAVIVLWSAASAQSTWVRAEATEAMERNKLVPVRLEFVPIPMPFGQLQTLDLFGDDADENYRRLDASLAALIRQAHEPAPREAPPARRPFASTPATRILGFDWKHAFLSLEGRLSRKQFWVASLVSLPVFAVVQLLTNALTGAGAPGATAAARSAGASAYFLISIYPSVALLLKRLHDINGSGWWSAPLVLLLFVAVSAVAMADPQGDREAGIAVLALNLVAAAPVIVLGLWRGTAGANRFGPAPQA